MINFKKMDDKDFVFINKNLSDKDDKAFSDFLKNRKSKNWLLKNKKKLSVPTKPISNVINDKKL